MQKLYPNSGRLPALTRILVNQEAADLAIVPVNKVEKSAAIDPFHTKEYLRRFFYKKLVAITNNPFYLLVCRNCGEEDTVSNVLKHQVCYINTTKVLDELWRARRCVCCQTPMSIDDEHISKQFRQGVPICAANHCRESWDRWNPQMVRNGFTKLALKEQGHDVS
jgi:hypothetical protein